MLSGRIFKFFLNRKISNGVKKNEAEMIRQIIRNSLEEFETGLKQYQNFRKSNDTPDWGVVRMSSISMSKNEPKIAENILKEQENEMGGKQRHARTVEISDDQIIAAIIRVEKNQNLESAIDFYNLLLKYRFCSNRDKFLSILIQKIVKKNGWKAGIEHLKAVLENEKREKNMKMSFYYIIEKAFEMNEMEKAMKEVEKLIKSSTLRNLSIFVRLNNVGMLTIVDYCKLNNITFSYDDIRFFVELSSQVKSAKPLINILDMDSMIKIPEKAYFIVMDELIKIAGKLEDFEMLENMIATVKKYRILENNEKLMLFTKIRHFYKCLNRKIPENLEEFIKKLRFS